VTGVGRECLPAWRSSHARVNVHTAARRLGKVRREALSLTGASSALVGDVTLMLTIVFTGADGGERVQSQAVVGG
jgi:hypothetical protein